MNSKRSFKFFFSKEKKNTFAHLQWMMYLGLNYTFVIKSQIYLVNLN